MSMLLRRYHEPAAEEVEAPEETPAPKPRRTPKPDAKKE
jgi:hypothetical protein